MKVIVAGGRDFVPTFVHRFWLKNKLKRIGATEVVSGCARGADTFGEETAIRLGLLIKQFPADWEQYGKRAGFLRNKQMAEYADACILFPGGRGTQMMRELASEYNLDIYEFEIDTTLPKIKKNFVVNLYRDKYDVFIGRPSKWGNPFIIGKDGSREDVIKKYEEYILSNPDLLNCLYELKGKVLGCFCKPLPCHGDVLLKLIKERCP